MIKSVMYETQEEYLLSALLPQKNEILIGTNLELIIWNLGNMSTVDTIKFSSQIKGISSSSNEKLFLVNTVDRKLHIYHYPSVPIYKFQDLIDRSNWVQAKFSNSGDYVIAGTGGKSKHNLYILNNEGGTLTKMLEGPKEGFIDFVVSYC